MSRFPVWGESFEYVGSTSIMQSDTKVCKAPASINHKKVSVFETDLSDFFKGCTTSSAASIGATQSPISQAVTWSLGFFLAVLCGWFGVCWILELQLSASGLFFLALGVVVYFAKLYPAGTE